MTLPDWKAMTPAQRADAIRPLGAKQLSAGEIARHFSGATRNAVIGVCMRNGIAYGVPRAARASKTRAPAPAKPRAVRQAPPASPVPTSPPVAAPIAANIEPMEPSRPVLFLDAEPWHCRWPLWPDQGRFKASEMFVCGAKPVAGGPYCLCHATEARGEGTPSERAALRAARAVKS